VPGDIIKRVREKMKLARGNEDTKARIGIALLKWYMEKDVTGHMTLRSRY